MSLSWNIPGPSEPYPLDNLEPRLMSKVVAGPDEDDESDDQDEKSELYPTDDDLMRMAGEADETRWWLANQKLWQDGHSITVPIDRKRPDTHVLYPLPDGRPIHRQKVRYFLKFDASVWVETPQGHVLFDPDDCKHPRTEVQKITRRLRNVRGE